MPPYLRQLAQTASITLTILVAASALGSAGSAWAASPAVSVYPINGSRLAHPNTQITFRGVPVGQFGPVRVSGSRTGVHSGRVVSDSDNQGGSFIPAKPFRSGETVTVSTQMNVVGGRGGTFQFTVSSPSGTIPWRPFRPSGRVRGDVWHFHSYPQINPVAISVKRQSSRTAHGYIFLTPWYGPVQNGVLITDSGGVPVWFKAVPKYYMTSDFREQNYHGKPVLTWWQGYFGAGVGSGVDIINDTSYHQVAAVHAGNGLTADLHAFELTPQGTALIVSEYPVHWDASSIHQTKNATVYDSVVQEIDIPTGLVLFQWDSLDHIPLNQSYTRFPSAGHPFDFFHLNGVQQDTDGNLIITARSTSAIYKIDKSSGHVIWTLGGKHSTFKLGTSAAPAFQHDAVMRGGSDNELTVFDNGAGLYNAHGQSRALWLRLDASGRTVSRIGELDHSPSLLSQFGGSVEQLYNGDAFVGWGQQPYFSEYNSRHQQIFDARFKDVNASYRAYRFRFTGYPNTQPRVAASGRGGRTTVWVSWNGDTQTHSWRVLAGSSPNALRTVTQTARKGFETTIGITRSTYVQVQALDSHGKLLSSSPVTKSR